MGERELDGLAWRGARIVEPVLARPVVRRVDHRVDRVDVLRDPLRELPDPEVARRREPEDVGRDTHAERLEPLRGVVDELGDHPGRRRRRLARVDDPLDVPVGREAHVVELDLVEAGARRHLGNRDVVVPDPPVIRVRPPEPGVVAPDGAARRLDREIRPALGKPRILEHHDSADQVDRTCAAPPWPPGPRLVVRTSPHRPSSRAEPQKRRNRPRRSRP